MMSPNENDDFLCLNPVSSLAEYSGAQPTVLAPKAHPVIIALLEFY